MSGVRFLVCAAALTVAVTAADASLALVGSPYLQCVPYARQVSGIQIYGDAYTWWEQARGRYARGDEPRVGAVMAFRPHGSSRLGHVAAVSRIVDDRTVLIRHANWSQRGKIENDVRAVDVSRAGDWSEVRVWYGPTRSLGSTHWPLRGFIYNRTPVTNAKPENAPGATRRDPAPAPRAPALPSGRSDPIGDIIAANED